MVPIHPEERPATVEPLIVPLATGVLVLDASARTDAPWTCAGPGTTKIACDGDAGCPRFEYHVHGNGGTWTFSAAASGARRAVIAWSYAGFHAWFGTRVVFERFVRRGGEDVFQETLTGTVGPDQPGPFVYCGTSTFDLWPGDTYGFRMSGRDFGS